MKLSFLFVVIIALVISFVTAYGGYWIASRHPAWYSQDRLSQFVGFGAGVLIALALVEFLPHSLENNIDQGSLCVLLGLFIVYVADVWLVPRLEFLDHWALGSRHEHAHEHHGDGHCDHSNFHHHVLTPGAACSAVGCLVVCSFFDGLELQSAFFLGSHVGWLTSIGLLLHILPEGVLAASLAVASGLPRKAAKITSIIIGVSLFLGVMSAHLLARWAASVQILMAVATGVLIYVCLVHLMPVVAKSDKGKYWFVAGAVIFALTIQLSHSHGM